MELIFFDLDNTLTDRKATVNAYTHYFVDSFSSSLKFGISVRDLSEQFNRFDKGGYETHEARSLLIRNLDIWQHKQTVSELSSHWQHWVPNHAIAMKGLNECLDELRQLEFRLCLVSNGQSKNQRQKINRLSVESYFEKIIISEEVGCSKPDKKIFTIALDAMGAKAENAFFVGDHPINDCIGSRKLGFTPIWLEGSHVWPDGYELPLRIQQLSELSPLVRRFTNTDTELKNPA